MADFSHSVQRPQASSAAVAAATLTKKISNNGFTSKNAYDDVFGGPPKFGVPSFSSRIDDYNEIFGNFHSSRVSSIPILDLPAVDEREVPIDVRGSRFDYSEVFGGFDGFDFAVSYEDLVAEPEKEVESSSEDVWTPAGTGTPSEGSSEDPACSENNQAFSNGQSHQSYNGTKQFNMSFHKTNQISEEDGISATTHIAQLNSVPAFTFVVDETVPLQKTEQSKQPPSETKICASKMDAFVVDESVPLRKTEPSKQPPNEPQICASKMDSGGEVMEVKHLKDPMPDQPACHTVTETSEIDSKPQKNPSEYVNFFDEAFLTVAEISLRTQPTHVPPPARPPPRYTTKQGESKRFSDTVHKASENFAVGKAVGNGSPPFFDVEVDASSSAAASAAAMKEAMEKAQARLKSAKESMERKRDGLQTRKKLGLKDDIKSRERRGSDISHEAQVEEKDYEIYESENSKMKYYTVEEKPKSMSKVKVAPHTEVNETVLNASKQLVEKHEEESGSTQESLEQENETGEWKVQEDFYELIKMDNFREAMEIPKHERKEWGLMPTQKTHEFERKPAKVAYDQREQKDEIMAVEEVRGWEIDGMQFEVVAEHDQEYEVERTVALESSEQENKEKHKMAHEREEQHMKEKESHEQEERDKELKEAYEQEERERKLKEIHEWEENEKKLKETHEREETERRLREARECEENERRLKQVHEQEENLKRQKEARASEENQKRLEEAWELEENEKQRREAFDRERIENEEKLKEVCEREENEKRQREAFDRERIENEKKLKKAREMEENEEKLNVAREREENARRLKEARDHEENEKRLKEAHEKEEKERRLKEAYEKEEKERQEREDNEKKIKAVQEAFECADEGRNKLASGNSPEIVDVEENLKAFYDLCEKDEGKRTEIPREGCDQEGQRSHETEEIGKKMTAARHASEQENGQNLKEAEKFAVEEDRNERLQNNHMNHSVPVYEEHENKKKAASIVKLDEDEMSLKESEDAIGQENNKKSKRLDQVPIDLEANRSIYNKAQLAENEKKHEATQPSLVTEEKGDRPKRAHWVKPNIDSEKNGKKFIESLLAGEREMEERLQRERDQEIERLRKAEEDREKEREREKDRLAVERATREARERAFADARERAERAAVERATAEARQRAMAEARERLEKASAEAQKKSLAEKASTEARIRAERAAVERATAEARERAVEKAKAEAALGTRGRTDRAYSEKFSSTSRDNVMRHSTSFSDLRDSQYQSSNTSGSQRYPTSSNHASFAAEKYQGDETESAQRCKARLERHQRTVERAAKALAEKNLRDLLTQREQTERNRLAETLDADVKRWSSGKEGNLRALLSTLQYILGPDSGWHPVPLTDVITAVAVKKAYRKATLCVHPDKLQQRGASIQQKYICEKVFDLLKEAWNKFNSEER